MLFGCTVCKPPNDVKGVLQRPVIDIKNTTDAHVRTTLIDEVEHGKFVHYNLERSGGFIKL